MGKQYYRIHWTINCTWNICWYRTHLCGDDIKLHIKNTRPNYGCKRMADLDSISSIHL